MEFQELLNGYNGWLADTERKVTVLLDPYLSLEKAFNTYKLLGRQVIESLVAENEKLVKKLEDLECRLIEERTEKK